MNAVKEVCRRELGSAPDDVARLDDGAVHDTYEVTCAGEHYVVQFAGSGDARSLRQGVGWYRVLADGDVPVPAVVTDTVNEFDGREYVVVKRVPGESGELAITPDRVRNAGGWLARLHDRFTFEAGGRFRFEEGRPEVEPFEADTLAARVHRSGTESAATFREYGFEEVAGAVERVAGRVEATLSETPSPRLCHGDFSPDNVVFDGERVAGILDFDESYAGHDQRDLARAANAFWMHDPEADWAPRERFYEGYRSVRDPGPDFDDREPVYRVETLAGTVCGMLRAEALSDYEQDFYAGALLEAAARV